LRLAPVGKGVEILVEPKLGRTDRHGRLLAYLARKPVGNINIELVRRGAAAPYFSQGKRGKFAKRLLVVARAAKAAKRGLWKACPGTKLDPNHHVETGPSRP
jgi:endonuclease YncB( thermonuclease family)